MSSATCFRTKITNMDDSLTFVMKDKVCNIVVHLKMYTNTPFGREKFFFHIVRDNEKENNTECIKL